MYIRIGSTDTLTNLVSKEGEDDENPRAAAAYKGENTTFFIIGTH